MGYGRHRPQYGLRPASFYFLAGIIVVGLVVVILFVDGTLPYAQAEADDGMSNTDADVPFVENSNARPRVTGRCLRRLRREASESSLTRSCGSPTRYISQPPGCRSHRSG